jgi:oxaloacetate decarboxylase alpha subunit
MADISLVDVSLRDGNQSLWGATGVTNRLARQIAPVLNDVGYKAIELFTSTTMATAVRFGQEDPWQRIRDVHAAAPETTLGFLTTGKRFITFGKTPDNLFRLAFELLRRNGVTRLWVIDPMHNMEDAIKTAELAKSVGFEEVIGGLCYSVSPVHTDEYYMKKVAELGASSAIDSVYLKDPAGLLTPERVREMVPRLQAHLGEKRIRELHTHTNTGVGPLSLLAGADVGMDILHTSLPPLANGTSHSNGIRLVENLRARGHNVDVDVDAMRKASDILQRHARLHRLPSGVPAEYDESYFRHNIPGGVMTTLRRQLSEINKLDLLPAVIEESVQVREDLGWPIVVTPFAQYIVTQATMNVMSGERWSNISDEVIDMLLGDFGDMPGTVNPDVLDRAVNSRRAERRISHPEEAPSIATLRERFGKDLSDEDLLLRAVMPTAQVDAMVEKRDSSQQRSLKEVFDAIADRPNLTQISFSTDKSHVSISRNVSS